jgi:Cytochrome C assembly protein
MADLDDRFAQWRHRLAEALGGSAEVLEELEGHLRDEVVRRVAQGQSADEAFAEAAEQLGRPAALAAEFARVAPPAPWLPVRFALVVLIAGAGWLAGMLSVNLGTPQFREDLGALLAVHIIAVTLGYSTTLIVGALAACYVLARPFGLPDLRQRQGLVRATCYLTAAALALTALAVVLGGFWAQQRLGRFWNWDPRETAALLVLHWDAVMLVLLGRRLANDHALLLLGLAGNVVVALAWFGPNLLGIGLHAYGTPTALPLGVFVLAQLALAALGFVPAGVLRRARARNAG